MSDEQNSNAHLNTDELDEIVVGRVKPHIYAFSTNTVPNYMKVGDTYRPVKVRLDEWRKKYSDLVQTFDEEASVSDDVYFRDYSVHEYLVDSLDKERLTPEVLTGGGYYSNEFFKDASVDDIETAIDDIKNDFANNTQRYHYYRFKDRPTPLETEYRSTRQWTPRPNQQEVIDNFKQAVKVGRTKLLLYAVMRFGKTFTSMCCANEMGAKVVLIVSAKADVEEEWRMTIQSADNFEDYVFINSKKLRSDDKIIRKTLSKNKKVAIFLTLQDLKDKKIKNKHKEVFDNTIDLLLVDETHFGARAEVYGRVLRDQKEKADDFIGLEDAEKEIKVLHPRITIHLSGTPYRILMSTEFEKEDIIGFYQASDILDAKKAWDLEHFTDIENQSTNPDTGKPYQEWDNPYFGFPQMVRFAFTPSKRIRNRLDELQSQGVKSKFDEVFRPKSTKKQSDGSHKEFVYSDDILEFLSVIDGSESDDSLMSFLDYEKINSGNLCRHIVFVLPYRASCDAMQKLLEDNSELFHNLNNYSIINISGVDASRQYSVNDVKRLIKKAESEGKKTITLTVNRMLTGSTVPEWDTMLYLKDTRSPQEYDQATFRLQNQFIATLSTDENDETIKYDKKPQTLLIDFSPNRIFAMQEERALVYNANIEKKGKDALIEQIAKDISYSPIIILDENRMRQVDAIDLLSAIDNYSRDRGIYDEAQDIPIDYGLLSDEDIRREIEKQGEFKSRQGFEMDSGEDDDEDIEEPSIEGQTPANGSSSTPTTEDAKNIDDKTLERQFKTYYSRILFYSALTDDNIATLKELIESIDENDDNSRIASNLGLNKIILDKINRGMDAFALYKLDNTITRINKLSNDKSLSELERAKIAISKFGRLSESEIVTPQRLADEIIEAMGANNIVGVLSNNHFILDIASKEAEFTLSLVNALQELGVDVSLYSDAFYSIPTSKIAYEFTRKIYKILGLNIDNIAQDNTTYDLLSLKDASKEELAIEISKYFKKEETMEFDAIVGNPPYQENVGSSTNRSLSKQLFPIFMQEIIKLNPRFSSLITPSRWFTGDGQDGSFPKLRDYVKRNNHFKKIVNFNSDNNLFDEVNVGSVNYYIYDPSYTGDVEFWEVAGDKRSYAMRPLFEKDMDEILPLNYMTAFLKKIKDFSGFESITKITSGRNPYKTPETNSKLKNSTSEKKTKNNTIKIRCAYGEVRYISRSLIQRNEDNIDKYKVFISKMNGGAGTLTDDKQVSIIGESYLGKPQEVCSGALISIGSFDNKFEACSLRKYLATKFLRFVVGFKKSSQALYQNVYQFVPLQDFSKDSDIDWTKSIKEIDEQLYEKYGFTKSEVAFIESKIKQLDFKEEK